MSVPVLSDPMTVVLPSASMLGSRRSTALRRAMRPTPIASVTVTATGRPSGTAETAIATAVRNISSAVLPSATPDTNVITDAASTDTPMTRAKLAMRAASGPSLTSWPRTSPAIDPSSVACPVATT